MFFVRGVMGDVSRIGNATYNQTINSVLKKQGIGIDHVAHTVKGVDEKYPDEIQLLNDIAVATKSGYTFLYAGIDQDDEYAPLVSAFAQGFDGLSRALTVFLQKFESNPDDAFADLFGTQKYSRDIADPDLLHMSMSVSDYYKDKADFLYGVLKPAFAGFDPFPDNLASGFYHQFLRMAGAEMDTGVIKGIKSDELKQQLDEILDEFETNRFSLKLSDDLKGEIVASVTVGVNKLLETLYDVGFGSGEFPPVSEIAEAVGAKVDDGKTLLKFASGIVTSNNDGNNKMNAFVTSLTDALLSDLLKVDAQRSKAFDHTPYDSPIMAYVKGDGLSFPLVSETAIRALSEMFLIQNKAAADLIPNNYAAFERSHMSVDFSKQYVRKWFDEDGIIS